MPKIQEFPIEIQEFSIEEFPVEEGKIQEFPIEKEILSRRVIPQLLTGIAEEVPFGRRFNLPVPIEQVPTPVNLPAKVARAGGRLLGMFPSFAIGGLGGGAVAKGVTGKLVTKLPRLAKYIGTGAGGATTF